MCEISQVKQSWYIWFLLDSYLPFGIGHLMVVKNIRVSGNNDHLIINKEADSMQLYERYIPTHQVQFK